VVNAAMDKVPPKKPNAPKPKPQAEGSPLITNSEIVEKKKENFHCTNIINSEKVL
jgi:hypothetical protein